MEVSELESTLREVIEKGFDDAFAQFCATTFSSYRYPPEYLAAARMHTFYLRTALEMLSCAESREALFGQTEVDDPLMKAFREVTANSYEAALSGDRPFCEVFVRLWCERWAYCKEA